MSYQDLMDTLVGGVCVGIEECDVRELLGRLSKRQRDILLRHYGLNGKQDTLKTIGLDYGVVIERVRQIEIKALARLLFLLTKEYEKAYTDIVFVRKRPVELGGTATIKLSAEDEAYVTGFCEGDGSIGMSKTEHSFIMFTQKEPDVLEYIETLIPGGTWHFSKQITMWSLGYNRTELRSVLLEMFTRHVVSGHFLERLNSILLSRDVSAASIHEPTISWLAGFFDAEGSVIWKHPACGLQISQKSRDVLDAIQRFFGGCTGPMKEQFQWRAGKHNSELTELANKLLNHSHKFQKREDLTSLLTRLYVEKRHTV